MLSFLLRHTDSDYPFVFFKLFSLWNHSTILKSNLTLMFLVIYKANVYVSVLYPRTTVDCLRCHAVMGSCLITCAIMPSWATFWLLALSWRHGERLDYLRYDVIMNNVVITCAIMASWAVAWLLALWWAHGQRIDYLNYDGVMGSF